MMGNGRNWENITGRKEQKKSVVVDTSEVPPNYGSQVRRTPNTLSEVSDEKPSDHFLAQGDGSAGAVTPLMCWLWFLGVSSISE